MFTRLERYAYAPTAALVLWAMLLVAAWPAVAEAQETLQANDPQGSNYDARAASYVVVAPGDSLWSISAERLGPNASPRRIMNGVERIHARNRERIGADPDLVFVSQELSIPRAMSGPSTRATVPARKAAEAAGVGAAGANPRDRAARGSAGKEAPRKAPRQGAIPRSEISLEEAAAMLGTDTVGKEALPEPRAVTPVPAVRMAASKDAQPGSFFGGPAAARAEGRRLLGLGVMVLTLVLATLVAAYGRGAIRRKARKPALRFRETYGGTYAASHRSASQEEASQWWVSEVRSHTPPSDGPTNAGAASEDRSDRTGPSAVARAKRARILRKRPPSLRRQSPQLQARRLRLPARAQFQRRTLSGRRRVMASARRKEWEPGAALVGALGGLPLQFGAGHSENLVELRSHLEGALGELKHLERRRILSEREKTRREALGTLLASIGRAEE